jgi:hypothetical protein
VRELLSLLGHTPSNGGRPRWFERDEGAERLGQDRALIRHDYPDLKYGLNFRGRVVFLDGTLTLKAECGIPTRIKTRIIFPDDYPRHEPVAYDAADMFPHFADRHFFTDGGCCLWLPVETEWDSQEPTTLFHFLDQLSTFFERQLIYDASPVKIWPWGERGHKHRLTGYIEFVQDALGGDASLFGKFEGLLSGREHIDPASPCPCGRDKKLRYCHAKRLAGIIERLGKDNPFIKSAEMADRSG